MELIDARLELAQVLPAWSTLEATLAPAVRVEPYRACVELELDEGALRRLNQNEVDPVALDELLNPGLHVSDRAAEVVPQDRLVPPAERHHPEVGLKSLNGSLETYPDHVVHRRRHSLIGPPNTAFSCERRPCSAAPLVSCNALLDGLSLC